jgi:hypothetical protein
MCRWGTLCPHKDHSSLLRWKANLNVPLCNYGIASMKVYYDFGVLAFFSCLWSLFWLFISLVEILGWCMLFCCLWSFGCSCLACMAWSEYESASSLGAWVGTKVLNPLRACVKVANCCDPFFVGTLTCVKTLVTMLRAFYHRILTLRYILVRMIRLSLHCIKSPNPRSLITKLQNHNLAAVRNRNQVQIRIVCNSILRQSANSAPRLYSNGHNHCCGYWKFVLE